MLSIIDIDHQVFHWINSDLSNNIFDLILPLLREKLFWVPVYLFIVAFAIMNFGKKGIYLVLAMFLCFGVSEKYRTPIHV